MSDPILPEPIRLEPIRLERSGDVAELVLNRPERRNALDQPAVAAFADALDELEKNPPRALLLRPRAGGQTLRYELGHGDLIVKVLAWQPLQPRDLAPQALVLCIESPQQARDPGRATLDQDQA